MGQKPFSAIEYILKSFSRSFLSFFSDWYIFLPRLYWQKVRRFVKDLDKSLSFKAMVRNWLNPLYQDYNISGYFIGVFIRTFWIIFDLIFYFLFSLITFLLFLGWLLILPALFWLIFANLI